MCIKDINFNFRTNTPRQTMEYAGFKFPEDAPSYPTGGCFYNYLINFVKYFNLMKYIQVSRRTFLAFLTPFFFVTYCIYHTIENRQFSWLVIKGFNNDNHGLNIHRGQNKASSNFTKTC